METGGGKDQRGVSESLREAIERTFAATAQTRDRAGDLLDEVSRRGQAAGEAAQEASTSAASRVVEAVEGLRLAGKEDLRELEARLDELSERVAALEARGAGGARGTDG